ncbi:DUF4240 domain-containing protein [Paractinoplanes toevensis]|uniref:DUF4240 domain-containing protein n=1 Tax=Paractinoplanes toevensis TaxID=571911 RepID=A0A919WCV6_9ACTN|nr:hypothetical protein Ato02nite_096110 [Actinoplanes toevensis]
MAFDFWTVVGSCSIVDRSDVEAALTDVENRLRALDLEGLVAFQGHLAVELEALNLGSLASIPIELPSGAVFDQTEDHFLYARCACLLSGRASAHEVISDPGQFSVFVAPRLQSAETLLYLARNEYRRRTGESMKGVRTPE